MSSKTKVILTIVAISLTFALGRFTSPTKVKVETKIVEVEKTTKDTNSDTAKNKHKTTTVTEVVHPDGTKETKTTTTEDSNANNKTTIVETSDKASTTDKTKEIVKSSGKLTIAAMGGATLDKAFDPIYGGQISKDLLGPISLGVWGLSNRTAGLSIGLSF